jgi:ribosome-binding factor A
MPGRMPRINELLKQELSRLIHEKVGDKAGLLTVTDVETTSDLRLAKVHISVLESEAEKARLLLQEQAPYFQSQLGEKLTMKFTPKLTFIVNDDVRYRRVEELLEKLS